MSLSPIGAIASSPISEAAAKPAAPPAPAPAVPALKPDTVSISNQGSQAAKAADVDHDGDSH